MNRNQLRRSCEGIPERRDSGRRIMDDPTPELLRVRSAGSRGFAEQEEVEQ